MNKKGFTLVELLMTLVIGLVVMAAIYAAMEMGRRSSLSVGRKVVTQQDARAVLNLMAMEIKMASCNPWGKTGMWVGFNPAASTPCTTPASPAKQLYKGIQLANANAIVVEMDTDLPGNALYGSGDGALTSENEIIYYVYDKGAGTISRQTGCGGPLKVILGGAGSGTKVVNAANAADVAAGGINLFEYYDNVIPAANPITALDLLTETGIRNIRTIQITIVVDNEFADTGSTVPRRMIYSTNVMVKNHVLSPF